jgi:hypothetical protein
MKVHTSEVHDSVCSILSQVMYDSRVDRLLLSDSVTPYTQAKWLILQGKSVVSQVSGLIHGLS